MDKKLKILYPGEKLPLISKSNQEQAGRAACLYFLNWLESNRNKLIALATGGTPVPFFDALKYYMKEGQHKDLDSFSISGKCFENLKTMQVVQLDEYFPLYPEDKESFHYLVKNNYLKTLGIPSSQSLLIDFSSIDPMIKSHFPDISHSPLDVHKLNNEQRAIAQKLKTYCHEYENEIDKLGGIQFFLGGLGPDGHIAFNQAKSSHRSITRFCKLSHYSAAYAAASFGGYSKTKNMTVMTIGLRTITKSKSCFSIILVSGRKKASILKESLLSEKSTQYPLTAFQGNKQTLVIADASACSLLPSRRNWKFQKRNIKSHLGYLFNSCLSLNLSIDKIQKKDLISQAQSERFHNTLTTSFSELKKAGLSHIHSLLDFEDLNLKNKKILHTAPHHDDIYLAYYPWVKDLKNQSFLYFTSAYRGVSDLFIQSEAKKAYPILSKLKESKNLLKTFQERNPLISINRFILSFLITSKVENFSESLNLLQSLSEGKGSFAFMKKLKGKIREYESNAVWNLQSPMNIHHFRSKLYESKTEKTYQGELKRLQDLLKTNRYDVITSVCDPFDLGPSAHSEYFKLLTNTLLDMPTRIRPKLLVYRNVWSTLPIREATIALPFRKEDLDHFKSLFKRAYTSQVDPEYPSPFNKEGFPDRAEKMFIEQCSQLQHLSGQRKKQSLKGIAFLKELSSKEMINYLKNGDF